MVDLERQAAGVGLAEPGVQSLQVPYINVGKFASLSARAPTLQGYTPYTYPFFWNTSLKN